MSDASVYDFSIQRKYSLKCLSESLTNRPVIETGANIRVHEHVDDPALAFALRHGSDLPGLASTAGPPSLSSSSQVNSRDHDEENPFHFAKELERFNVRMEHHAERLPSPEVFPLPPKTTTLALNTCQMASRRRSATC